MIFYCRWNKVVPYQYYLHNFTDGGWSRWTEWEICSVSCGGGTQTQSRTCTAPTPNFGGKDCVGEATGSEICAENNCPVGNYYVCFLLIT